MNRLGRILLASLVAGIVVGLPTVAEACSGNGCGGVTLQLERPYYKPGEVAKGRAYLNWPRKDNPPVGSYEGGPYNVYLRPMNSRLGRTPENDSSAIRVGTLTLGSLQRHRYSSIEAQFIVPFVAGGRYLLQYCAPGCDLRPGILSDTAMTIVSSDGEERDLISDQINRVEQMTLRARYTATRLGYKARKALHRAKSDLRSTIYSMGADVVHLEDEIERLRRQLDKQPPTEDGQLGTMAFAGSILIAGAMLRRRKRESPAPLG